jgi:putative transposase
MVNKYSKADSLKDNSIEQLSGKFLSPFQRKLLLKNLKADLRSEYRRRIEIMLLADRGQSQTEICQALNCAHDTARYWIGMAKTGQAHKWKDLPIGRPKSIDEKYLARLEEIVKQSPQDLGYVFERWTARWLNKHLAQEFGIEMSDRHINRLLKKMGLSTRYKSSSSNQKRDKEQLKTNNSNLCIGELSSTSAPKSLNFGPFKPTQEW